MKFISKNEPPLIHHRLKKIKNAGGNYSNLKNDVSKSDFIKDEVLTALLDEQNNLCAYCMKRILLSDATIEHIIGQNYKQGDDEIGKENQLNYDNFLAVCDGQSCKEKEHCDKSRSRYQKDRPLFTNPLVNRIMSNIRFSESGNVYYKDSSKTIDEIIELKDHNTNDEDSNIKYDLQVVLNLNCRNLKEKRKIILDALKKYTSNWSNKERVRKKHDEYLTNPSNEFSQVVIYHLSKKL